MSKNRTCIVCGKTYIFCGHCSHVEPSELWHNIYCSEDCRGIFDVCSRYAGNDISADDANNKLNQYGVNNKDLQLSVKATVQKIQNNATKPNIEIDEIIEKTLIESTEIESIKTEQPKRRYRRRNKKIED